MERGFLPAGQLQIGANYWASHAGVWMWRNWRPDIVQSDFDRLSKAGLGVLRVFPLWPDFQPIHCLRREGGQRVEYRHGEDLLADDPVGQSGVSVVMLDRLAAMGDMAGEHGLKLIVSLVTGWMSGRLFIPPGLEGLNPITDPNSIMWQTRMVSVVVNRLKGHAAICAWEPGNECNCLGEATREQAWVWTAAITNAIRRADPTRPVISGMHALPVDPAQPWAICDQAELADILTTHPYPLFTPHCNREPMHAMRPLLHSTAEVRLYADLSGRAAFVEEMGNFGPAFCGEAIAADIVRAQLFSLWAHDCRAAFWWCAHDQTELTGAPYDWISMERELGLLRADGSSKPVLLEMDRVRRTIAALPIDALPPRRIDAVCILTGDQDQWGVAFSSFLLARQAGFDVRFHHGDRPLPEAALYLLPSVKGLRALPRHREDELLERVKKGATLYVSMDDAILGGVMRASGLEVIGRYERSRPCKFQLSGESEMFTLCAPIQFDANPGGATILAQESDGRPVLSVAPCGKGKVCFLTIPLEAQLGKTPGAFLAEGQPFWKIYQIVAEESISRRHLQKASPWLGITEHVTDRGGLIAVLINHLPEPLRCPVRFSDSHQFDASFLGAAPDTEGNEPCARLDPLGCAVWHFVERQDV